jgi:L-threonylcarbamoyladenylate synthase
VIKAGGLVAFPTETVYGLGANALDAAAVDHIFSAKGRPASDPIIVHVHDQNQLHQVARAIPDLAFELAGRFWPGPLTLVLWRHPDLPANISAGRDTVAVRMPSHPVALALLQMAGVPIAAPSANRFSRPSATSAQHVAEDLIGHVDIILDGGPASIGLESTILDLTKSSPEVLRPGGISLEALQALIPRIHFLPKHLQADDPGIAAPGMLIKHYSPRAELRLFDGSLASVLRAMQSNARELLASGKHVGVLTLDSERYYFDGIPVEIFLLGADLESISHSLFEGMRELDRAGVDVILVRNVEHSGLGLALRDRLLRAAEGRVIEC